MKGKRKETNKQIYDTVEMKMKLQILGKEIQLSLQTRFRKPTILLEAVARVMQSRTQII